MQYSQVQFTKIILEEKVFHVFGFSKSPWLPSYLKNATNETTQL